MEKSFEERAKELKDRLEKSKKNEIEGEKKQRMSNVLKQRDDAIQTIYDYQDITGVPNKEETEKNFFEIEANQND